VRLHKDRRDRKVILQEQRTRDADDDALLQRLDAGAGETLHVVLRVGIIKGLRLFGRRRRGHAFKRDDLLRGELLGQLRYGVGKLPLKALHIRDDMHDEDIGLLIIEQADRLHDLALMDGDHGGDLVELYRPDELRLQLVDEELGRDRADEAEAGESLDDGGALRLLG